MKTRNDNWIDPEMPADKKPLAEKVLNELGLSGLRVRLKSDNHHLSFTQDRRVVEVPLGFIESQRWIDIRFLFRAILDSAPSQWNLSADGNDWSAYRH